MVVTGVLVMKMATDMVEAFPVVPQGIEIPTSLKDLNDRRITMAKTILQCSVFSETDHCSSCGPENPTGQKGNTKWVECTKCKRWYHPTCMAMSDEEWEKEEVALKWNCGLC
ncbi:unnamed protein product [Arctogadus glacialis]